MKGPDSVSMAVDNLPSALASRRHQMFPQLTDAEIARISRFGTPRH
jgi:thioredoxin reductase (NADPH)